MPRAFIFTLLLLSILMLGCIGKEDKKEEFSEKLGPVENIKESAEEVLEGPVQEDYEHNNNLEPKEPFENTTSSGNNSTQAGQQTPSTPEYSLDEIANHSTSRSCWIIVDGKVYDVTSFLSQHPGGAPAILQFCGRDATQAFYGKPHSKNAVAMLSDYLIGKVKGYTPPNNMSTSTSGKGYGEDYYEDKDEYKEDYEE